MRRRPATLQQSGGTEKEGAHADRCHILCLPALAPNELHGLDVGQGIHNAGTTGHTNQVERGRAFERTGRHDAEAAVAGNRSHGLCDNVSSCVRVLAGNRDRGRRRKPAQDFKRAGEVELCDAREDDEADIDLGHDHSPPQMPGTRSVPDIISLGEDVRNGQKRTSTGSVATSALRQQQTTECAGPA